ncbi:MAG: 16S rRNA (cytosine(967)-C(5))-methyltransferase RsmB, partial [Desulfuromonadaceae bacterium]|nr:16S rRNA (cytosine(967)-C(5))-methyltransferase RsmB [Desulfuromonadaceae bacterium]
MKNDTVQVSARPASCDPRQIAFEVLARVEQGAFADLALDAALSRAAGIDPRDRGLATELVYGVLRCRGRLDFVLAPLSRQPYARLEPALVHVLRLGAYQILHLDRVPERAAVHEAVEMAKRIGLARASGFVNGVLRSLIRGRESLVWPDPVRQPVEHLVHALSLPPWLAERLLLQLGPEGALAAAASFLAPAPLVLRTNTCRGGREPLLEELAGHGSRVEATRYAPEGIRVLARGEAKETSEWREEGRFQAQDEASMLIAHLLTPQPGERILDACAAPGGKTTHLAALTDNRAAIVACDLYPGRLRLVRRGAERLGCQGIETLLRDWCQKSAAAPRGPFDRVLVDAPCSGLGVLRRNPEIRWRRTAEEIRQLAALQKIILDRVAPLVRPGGTLVYSVCTFTAEETDDVVAAFLKSRPDFRPVDLRPLAPSAWLPLFDQKGRLRTWPHC